MSIARIKRISEIISGGISTKDHGHIAISNTEAEEIKNLCKKELNVQDRSDYHKAYYIKNPDKYNQRSKRGQLPRT